MPIYEYRCGECGEEFEKWLRSISGQHDVHCPRCGSARVNKSISLIGSRGSAAGHAGLEGTCAPTGG